MNSFTIALTISTHLASGGDVVTIPPAPAGARPANMPIAITPDAVAWKPGPPSLPAGAQTVVLEGDPTKPGIVTMRLKVQPGFKLAMHTHDADERVTILSGKTRVTYFDDQGGTAAAQTNTKHFPAGSFYVTPKGVPHAVSVDEETVIQITVEGPWVIHYMNAKDDPRHKK